MLWSFELEGIAGQLQIGHLSHGDLQQPGEGVWLDDDVPAPGYRHAQRAPGVSERVALQDHAVALGHLQQRIRRADVLEGLTICHERVDARDVNAFQLRATGKGARLDSELAAVGHLDLHRVLWDHSFGDLDVLEKIEEYLVNELFNIFGMPANLCMF